MDPVNILAPNYMGHDLANRGVESMVANQGLGVQEIQAQANSGAVERDVITSGSQMLVNKMRVAKAREFGKTKETVGF